MDGDDVNLTVAAMVSDILQNYSHVTQKAGIHAPVYTAPPVQKALPKPVPVDVDDSDIVQPITYNRGNVPLPTSVNTVTNVKVRLKEYKERILSLEADVAALEKTLVDERTEMSMYKKEQTQLINNMKESFKRETNEVVTANKLIVEKLLAEKKDIAQKCEDLANLLHKTKLEQVDAVNVKSENEILKTQLEKVKQEHKVLKETMDEQIEKVKHRIQNAENKKRKQAVEEAVEQTKKTLALGLEPKLQEMDVAHKSEIMQLAADHEAALRKQKQELMFQHEDALTKQRTTIMQQSAEEIDQLREEMQQKIKKIRADLQDEHNLDIENIKKRLRMEHEASLNTEASKLRNMLSEKSLECDVLNDKLQKVTTGARKSIEDLKLAYIAEMDKYKLAYTNEVSLIKTQYKELARTLWLQSKSELIEQVRNERDNLLQELAKSWDTKVEGIRMQEQNSVQARDSELTRIKGEVKSLTTRLNDKEVALEDLQEKYQEAIEKLARATAAATNAMSRQGSRIEQLRMYAEDYRCLVVQQKLRRREFDTRLREKVEERILAIVTEKDAQILKLTQDLSAEQQRSTEYMTQLIQLQELTNIE